MAMKIRSRENLANSFWDWTFLNGHLGESGGVSDIDGLVERRGRFLVFETKNQNEKMSMGQGFALEALVKTGLFIVVILHGPKNNPEEMEVWSPGIWGAIRKKPRQPCSHEILQDFCRRWWKWADKRR